MLACKDFVVFVVFIAQLSTCATRTLTVLSVGYGWQSPYQEVDDLFEIMKHWCLVIFWHGNCFVSLFKRDWNCWSSSFNLNFGFNFVFCIGMTAVKPSLILTFIFFLIGHFRFLWQIFVSLSNETETVWANSFILNFGLVYLILFLDEHSPIHLQIIFYFVANFIQRSNLLLIDCCRSQHLEQQIFFYFVFVFWMIMYVQSIVFYYRFCCKFLLSFLTGLAIGCCRTRAWNNIKFCIFVFHFAVVFCLKNILNK